MTDDLASDQVLVLTTGGTIDKLYFDALSDYQIGQPLVERLLEAGRVTRPFKVCELMRKDSLELTEQDRMAIITHARGAVTDKIVITHGTDTMTETAKALFGIEGKTIVLTGALAPARFADSDATFNLGMAFAAAQVAPPGIYIAMNGWVFRADEVVKDRSAGAFVRTPLRDN